jgi:hypothetical protein
MQVPVFYDESTITDQVMFTHGSCLVLAVEVHNLTGWPVYAFMESGEFDTHAFVQMPNGHYLDIDGEQTRSQLVKRWACNRIMRVSDDMLDDMLTDWGDPYDYLGSAARAITVASELVAGVDRPTPGMVS